MAPTASAALLDESRLTRDQLDQFSRSGYLVLPGFLPARLVERLRPEVDHWVDQGFRARSIASCVDPARHGAPPLMELELPAHGELIGHRPLLSLISQVMEGDLVFHHLHSDRQAPDVPGKPWHHDFEQGVGTDRSSLMVHALHYLDGLDPSVSSLAVLPGSHLKTAEKSALADHGTSPLPGEVVIDSLPAGSTVLLHSALFHARRPQPGGTGKPRYFVDASYCSANTMWPPVKPYWRHMLGRARELGLGDDVQWPELFADRHFTEYSHGN
ncbi:phytanoyl-CoA dioxygenase family protein [Streptomyces sp. NPDC058308]|uniref:phytanoyl-CoA dioxygenase family protein n=1 Tax=Streptomyces sp. NPDC058308 TaxID=3346440 RepID=UPI0036E2F199